MRWLIDARPLVDQSAGGVPRVARELVHALIEQNQTAEIILGTTGIHRQHFCHPRESGDPVGREPLDSRFHGNDNKTQIRPVHLTIPNKLWSAACVAGVASFDRAIEKRSGPIDITFLPNLGFTGALHRPYILLLHDLSFLIEPRWYSRKGHWWHKAIHAKKCIRGARHLLAVSDTTKQDAIRLLNIPPERITVLPLGPTLIQNAHLTPNPFPKLEALPYVLVLGGNDPRKNSATAIDAVAGLRVDPTHANLHLVIVGASHPTPHSWIHTIPRPSDHELAWLYDHAATFLYPSWYEGYGLPLHEAHARGIPCIASTTGALPETAPPGTLFAEPAKSHHWIEALRLALSKKSDSKPLNPPSWKASAQILDGLLRIV